MTKKLHISSQTVPHIFSANYLRAMLMFLHPPLSIITAPYLKLRQDQNKISVPKCSQVHGVVCAEIKC